MKKLIITLGIVFVLAFALVGCGATSMSNAWSYTGLSYENKIDSWTISAETVDGSATRNIKFNSDNLAALYVESTNDVGEVFLIMTQDDIERTINLTRAYDGKIDTSVFKTGSIKLQLKFMKAENVNIVLNW